MPQYNNLTNGPDAEFTYVRVLPASVPGDTGSNPATLIPAPATAGNYLQPIVLEFLSKFDVLPPTELGNPQYLAPNVEAMRVEGTEQLRGFTVPGVRDSGGIGEVRAHPKVSANSYSSIGTLIPVNVAYAESYAPEDGMETAQNIRLVLTPVDAAAAGILWTPGNKIVVDFQRVLPTLYIVY